MDVSFSNDVQFQKLLTGHDEIDLVALLLEFAADHYPDLDRHACRQVIHHLGLQAVERVYRDSSDDLPQRLKTISQLLYVDEGFHGNEAEYDDPRNSYLNEVLERRTGIPITLCLVYRAVAAQAGIEMYGVGTPGHFVLGCQTDDGGVFVDAFSGGEVLTLAECRAAIERRLGQTGVLRAEDFRPARSLEIAARVLRNLKGVYVARDQWTDALTVQHRLALLLPGLPDETRDLGLIHLRLGRPRDAAILFDRYLKACSAPEADAVMPFVRTARRLAAELN